MEQLAKNLVAKYPKLGDARREDKGFEMWFFHGTKHGGGGGAATGFLEERLKGMRKRYQTKKKVTVEDSVIKDNDVDWKSEHEEGNKKIKINLYNFKY